MGSACGGKAGSQRLQRGLQPSGVCFEGLSGKWEHMWRIRHDSNHDDDGRDERSHFSILGSPCMESRVNLVETQAEMRGCDRIEQISPLNVIDVNKVKPSSLSSSSLASKSSLLMTFLQIMSLTLLLSRQWRPCSGFRTSLHHHPHNSPHRNPTTPRRVCPCCSRSAICFNKTLNYAGILE